jgi:hypothetical protein
MKGIQIVRSNGLRGINNEECVAGYMAGFNGKGCPNDATYSFRHGWRNGACDRGVRPIDDAQRELARDVVANGWPK